MTENKKKAALLSAMMVTGIAIFYLGFEFSSSMESKSALRDPDNLKVSGSPISITGNGALAAVADGGDGSSGNPYYIEHRVINGSGFSSSGIMLRDIDAYLVINNCTVTDTDDNYSGILLWNVTNCMVGNCTIQRCYQGIYTYQCWYGELDIANNVVSDNSQSGIHLVYDSVNVTVRDNLAEYNGFSGIAIEGTGNYGNIAWNNTCRYNERHGITLLAESENNTVAENYITENERHGIYLRLSAHGTNISNNQIYFNNWDGIHIADTNHTHIANNEILGNQYCIVNEDPYENQTVTGNTCNSRPVLSDGLVNPQVGINTNDLLSFSVKYTDPDNDPPTSIIVTSNQSGFTRALVKQDSGDNDYTDGAGFGTSSKVPQGWHRFTFQVSFQGRIIEFLVNTDIHIEAAPERKIGAPSVITFMAILAGMGLTVLHQRKK
ncbi:hypothetical protein GF325_03540 [Candidatus Bathyarchaeota archaeon]|nr:hypothetical protein [Candidatus Bathyarchaeota archaeon]